MRRIVTIALLAVLVSSLASNAILYRIAEQAVDDFQDCQGPWEIKIFRPNWPDPWADEESRTMFAGLLNGIALQPSESRLGQDERQYLPRI